MSPASPTTSHPSRRPPSSGSETAFIGASFKNFRESRGILDWGNGRCILQSNHSWLMATEMAHGGVELPDICEPVGSCIDYQAYAFRLPRNADSSAWAAVEQALLQLGKAQPMIAGVTRVSGSWGFMVVPPQNFPELKVNFFHHIDAIEQTRILSRIADVLYPLYGGRS